MSAKPIQINDEWFEHLKNEFEMPYFKDLRDFVQKETTQFKIYPPGPFIFEAFNRTPFSKVKVVLLGQDPYHGEGQAHGLCFSVQKGVTPPPSLKNIFKELKSDLNLDQPNHGDLSEWADQGVFLLNATLTVRANQAGSHQGKGWETFTDHVIAHLSDKKEHLVFMLWGKFAQSKAQLIDDKKHLVLKAAHPSPFSAHTGFLGCKHFSQCNAYLQQHDLSPINWSRKEIHAENKLF